MPEPASGVKHRRGADSHSARRRIHARSDSGSSAAFPALSSRSRRYADRGRSANSEGNCRWRFGAVPGHQLKRRAAERNLPGEHFKQNDAEAVNIGDRGDGAERLRGPLLRRHVKRRAVCARWSDAAACAASDAPRPKSVMRTSLFASSTSTFAGFKSR